MSRPSLVRRPLSSARPAPRPAPRARLGVLSLEDRTVPAVFTVTTLADEDDGVAAGGVSLREAIAAANALPGDDTIDFAVAGTINLTGALPELGSNINVAGPGADRLTVRRDSGGDYGILSVNAPAVRVSGLTFSDGNYVGLFAGDDWVGVTVGDGRLSTSGSIAAHVTSAAAQAAALKAQVDALRAAGELNGGQANALAAKLDLRGNGGDVGKVQAFLSQVQAFLNAGILTPAEADALTGPGHTLLLAVSRQ